MVREPLAEAARRIMAMETQLQKALMALEKQTGNSVKAKADFRAQAVVVEKILIV